MFNVTFRGLVRPLPWNWKVTAPAPAVPKVVAPAAVLPLSCTCVSRLAPVEAEEAVAEPSPREVARAPVADTDELELFSFEVSTSWLPLKDAVATALNALLAFRSRTSCALEVPAPLVTAMAPSELPSTDSVRVLFTEVLTVAFWSVPVSTAFCEKLPSSAWDTRSPASTWKAALLESKVSCVLPLESVLSEAVTPAFLNAVACWVAPLPAFWIAVLIAVTSVFASVTPVRFTETLTGLLLPKPGPWKVNVVNPPFASEPVLVVFARMLETLVDGEPVPMSVPAAPIACTPCNPRLWASTVDLLKSTETDPFWTAVTCRSSGHRR